MARRILLYSHDTMGLGHIRRVSEIGRKLATDSPDDAVLILTGSTITGSLRLPQNVDCVKLRRCARSTTRGTRPAICGSTAPT